MVFSSASRSAPSSFLGLVSRFLVTTTGHLLLWRSSSSSRGITPPLGKSPQLSSSLMADSLLSLISVFFWPWPTASFFFLQLKHKQNVLIEFQLLKKSYKENLLKKQYLSIYSLKIRLLLFNPSVSFSFNLHLVSSTFIKTSLVLTVSAHHYHWLDMLKDTPNSKYTRWSLGLISDWRMECGRGPSVCCVAVGSPEVVHVLLNPDLTLQKITRLHTHDSGEKTPHTRLWRLQRKIYFRSLLVFSRYK